MHYAQFSQNTTHIITIKPKLLITNSPPNLFSEQCLYRGQVSPYSSDRTCVSLSAIQLSTTSVFQMNCRKAEFVYEPCLPESSCLFKGR
ncbi:hypothetical protein DPMN_155829 [Dreissena polymorpha]|uniref:Uncharacterized protein n=1 Tax=Dreissena polymorpha TaxID=45954 RepID=A0A9D4JBA0_DREPO|nr:hypothetical protein DPMN_155829 [Dreissena polymorpha]